MFYIVLHCDTFQVKNKYFLVDFLKKITYTWELSTQK